MKAVQEDGRAPQEQSVGWAVACCSRPAASAVEGRDLGGEGGGSLKGLFSRKELAAVWEYRYGLEF